MKTDLIKVTIRFTPKQFEELRANAASRGVSMAEYVREGHGELPSGFSFPVCPTHKVRMGRSENGYFICLSSWCQNKVEFSDEPLKDRLLQIAS